MTSYWYTHITSFTPQHQTFFVKILTQLQLHLKTHATKYTSKFIVFTV